MYGRRAARHRQTAVRRDRGSASLQEEKLRLEPILSNFAVDERAADNLIDSIAEARAALEKAEGRNMLSMRAVLTPEQWTKASHQHGMGDHADNHPIANPGQPNAIQHTQSR